MFQLILISILAFGTVQAEVGFQNGEQLDITTLDGHLTVYCRDDGFKTFHYNCREYFIDPGSHDYFQHPPVDADKVKLTATHPDGSTRSKKNKFNGETGLSKKRFNLAISSLFQRPLLHRGINTVDYTLTKKGEEVSSGSFEATVTLKEERECPFSTRTYYFEDQCRQTRACHDYFRSYNYCKAN